MMYIMRRTQLYLEDDLWQVLQLHARQSGSTMSELVRKAIRDAYLGTSADRKAAMTGIMGLWKDRDDIGDPQEYVRKLRRATGKNTRLDRLK
jgi:Ribbon-helix-helix protein, copG family